MQLLELRQQRAKLIRDARAILNKAEKENRSLNEAEEGQYEDLLTKAENMLKEINREERQQALETDLQQTTGLSLHQQTDPKIGLNDKEAQQYSLVRAIKAAANNDWRGAEFEQEISQEIANKRGREAVGSNFFVPIEYLSRAVLYTDVAAAAGDLVADDLLAGSFIDLLRNRLVVRQAGAQVLNNLRGNVSIPKQTGGATLYWVDENEALTKSNLTVGQVNMSPKTAGGSTEFSMKLLRQSSVDIENLVRSDLAATIATGLDFAALHGATANKQPNGIINLTGVSVVSGGTNGAAPDWSHVVDLETQVAINNADMGNLGYITNTKVRGKLKTTEKASSTAQYVWQMGNAPLNGYPAYVTNQVSSSLTKGTGTNLSAIFFGNWNDLIIGQWGTMEVLVDPYSNSLGRLVRLVAFIEVDIAVRHEESFSVMKDAITS